MKVSDILNQRKGKPFASFELVPPLKGSKPVQLENILRPLMEVEPPFVNITCHRDEIEFHPNADGTFTRLTLTKRPGTVAICAAAMRYCPNTEIVPHVICGGATRHQIENELLDLNFLGIENVMALRGDAPAGQRNFIPEPDGFTHSCELVAAIDMLGRGKYLDPTVKEPHPARFCVGVAGYPEKHFEAANLEEDILHLKQKVEAGADYVVTQMFFDNKAFFAFKDRCRAAGITVPIIPGLKPLTAVRQLDTLPPIFHLDIPQELAEEMRRHDSPEAAREIGKEWCVMQSRELLSKGVPAIHYYTMGNPSYTLQIVKEAF